MGMGNAGGLGGLLGELIGHISQQQGVSPQDLLQQHGVTETDIHPDNVSHESIVSHLMSVAQQNPQLLQGLMAALPALMGSGQQQGAAGGGSVLGALLGGLAGGSQPQQGGGGDMLGSLLGGLMGGGAQQPQQGGVDTLSGMLGNLMGGGQAAPAEQTGAPAAPAVSPQVAQLISGLLSSMNKQ